MSPSFLLLTCLGGIVCLTPLSVYLFWVSSLNRKPRPTIVSASWDFVATLVGLSGFLFCTGALLASAVVDLGLFTHGPFHRLAVRLPWLNLAWFVTITLYVLLVARAVRKGVSKSRDSFSVFNVDESVLAATIDEALLLTNTNAKPVEVTTFPVFRHATVRLSSQEPEIRRALESQLRRIIPRLPAAADNPAAPWVTAATTCTIVTVACCIVLIFVLPFLRHN